MKLFCKKSHYHKSRTTQSRKIWKTADNCWDAFLQIAMMYPIIGSDNMKCGQLLSFLSSVFLSAKAITAVTTLLGGYSITSSNITSQIWLINL